MSIEGRALDGACLVLRPDRGVIRVMGADRAEWLQGLLTNDVAALEPGRGCYAVWLTPQGRMLTDAVALAESGSISLDVPGRLTTGLLRRLETAVFAEDVQVADESATWASIGVHGAQATDVLARVFPDRAGKIDRRMGAAWPELAHVEPVSRVLVTREDTYGTCGYWLRLEATALDTWWTRLLAAGATPVEGDALEYARIEAGRPQFLVDMDEDTIPLEAGIESRAISFTKGCYVGQEVIVRVLHRGGGRVARRLVGLQIDGSTVPHVGARVGRAGADAGRVTSAAWSPRRGAVVALGMVRRESGEPGTSVTVDCGDIPVAATVVSLPMP